MGTPLPANEPATPCTSCWGIGKPFGDNPTPELIQVRLTNLLPGEFSTPEIEQDLLVTHYLQRVIDFCTWEITANGLLWRLVYSDQFTTLVVESTTTGKRAFLDTLPPTCQLDFPSALIVPDDHIAYNGFANITWDLEGL